MRRIIRIVHAPTMHPKHNAVMKKSVSKKPADIYCMICPISPSLKLHYSFYYFFGEADRHAQKTGSQTHQDQFKAGKKYPLQDLYHI